MTTSEANSAVEKPPVPAGSHPLRLAAVLLRLWRLYLETPIGCEITSRRICARNPGDSRRAGEAARS